MRVALLPSTGFIPLLAPFIEVHSPLLNIVDKFYISVAGKPEDYSWLEELYGNKLEFLYSDKWLHHGESIDALLNKAGTDGVALIIEDDSIIRDFSEVENCFKAVENGEYDIIGSNVQNASQALYEYEKTIFDNIQPSEDFDNEGAGFWPCHFFFNLSLLDGADIHCEGKAYNKGDTVPYIGMAVDEETAPIGLDIFHYLSIQLRTKTNKILRNNAYRSNCYTYVCKPTEENLVETTPSYPWTHVGLVGYIIRDILTTNNKETLHTKKTVFLPYCSSVLVEHHIEISLGYIQMMLNVGLASGMSIGREELFSEAQKAIAFVRNECGISEQTHSDWTQFFVRFSGRT